MTLTLTLFDTDPANPRNARVSNQDFAYQVEQWVQETSQDARSVDSLHPVVRWDATDETNTLVARWSRRVGNMGLPDLIYKHPSFTGEWVVTPSRVFVSGTRHEPEVFNIVRYLREHNITVTSNWHDLPRGDVSGPGDRARVAATNWGDIDRSTHILAVPCASHHLRGCHTELGYSIGRGIPVVVLGDHDSFNTMTEVPLFTYAASMDEVLPMLHVTPTTKVRVDL